MNRRGSDIALTQAAMMILVIAVAIVIFAWYIRMHNAAQVKKDIEQCHRSTAMYGNSMIDTPGADIHLFNRNCRRRIVTFTKDHVEVNGERLTFWDPVGKESSKKYKELTPEIVNSVVASELSICWYENLEGKEYLINEGDLSNNLAICLPCAEIRFEPAVSKAYTAAKQEDLFIFLEQHTSRPYPLRNKKLSYYDYLYNNGALCDNTKKRNTFFAALLSNGVVYNPSKPQSCQEQLMATVIHPEGSALKILPNKAYTLFTWKLGADMDTVNGKPAGTTYVPLILAYDKITSDICKRYLT